MTYDDDHLVIDDGAGTILRATCKELGLEWPPPQFVGFNDPDTGAPLLLLRRVSFSLLTDEQRGGMTHVMRGAAYVVECRAGGEPCR